MRYEGVVYRPPSEARSLIIQVTIGCGHNKCTFCSMYKDKRFRIRSKEEIFADLEEMSVRYGSYPLRIFLADGDALVLPADYLMEILEKIHLLFPNRERITIYGSAKDVLRKKPEELKRLREAGLTMVYMGAESGDPVILEDIKKGISSEELVEASKRLKESGIALSLTLISGLGGRERLQEHALASASLVTDMKPEYLGFLTLMLKEGVPMLEQIKSGRMHLLSPDEVLEEMKLFLENVDSDGTEFRANHASNYVVLKGKLNHDREKMLQQIEAVKMNQQFRPEALRGL